MILLEWDKYADRVCNSCHKDGDVKVIKVGLHTSYMSNIALCAECRAYLVRLLENDQA